MLTVVEDDQHRPIAQELHHAVGHRHALALAGTHRVGNRLEHEQLVARGCQITEPDAIGESGQHLRRRLQCQSGLPHAADTGERHQSGTSHQLDEGDELVVATYEGRHLDRQVPRECLQGSQGWKLALEPARADLVDPGCFSEVAEAVLAQVQQVEGCLAFLVEQSLRGIRDQQLSAVRDRHEPRRPVQRGPVVVTIAMLRFARMDPHTHAQRTGVGP